MRYQQTPLSRLSRAAAQFEADGRWHAGLEPRTFHRVLLRTVQRVRLEEGEDMEMLALVEGMGLLPSRALREGFREELCLRIEDDHYLLAGTLVRAWVGWDALARAASAHGARCDWTGGTALQVDIIIPDWTPAEILRALALSKAFARVAAQLATDAREGVPHIQSEISGLLAAACALHLEDMTPGGAAEEGATQKGGGKVPQEARPLSRGRDSGPHGQQSLFQD
jgi:hypothetical protein